jgi:hypothetical protein
MVGKSSKERLAWLEIKPDQTIREKRYSSDYRNNKTGLYL